LCIAAGHFLHPERVQARALGAPGYFKSYPTKKRQATRRKITDLLLDAEKTACRKRKLEYLYKQLEVRQLLGAHRDWKRPKNTQCAVKGVPIRQVYSLERLGLVGVRTQRWTRL
jgi:hypothetical protein